jgi:hypothetical protein
MVKGVGQRPVVPPDSGIPSQKQMGKSVPSPTSSTPSSPVASLSESHKITKRTGLGQKIATIWTAFKVAMGIKGSLSDQVVRLAKTDPEGAGRLLAQSTIPSKKLEVVVQNIMTQIKESTVQARVIIGASKYEIENHNIKDPGSLLRGTTVASKLLGEFNNQHVMPIFARSQLMSLLKELPVDDLPDPEKEVLLKEKTEKVLVCIIKVLEDDASPELQVVFDILREVNKAANLRFPAGTGEAVAMNLIFLRGVNVGIWTPGAKKFPVEYQGAQQNNAKLVTKIIQNLVNGLKFGGKEAHMAVFNDFLTEKDPLLEKLKEIIFKEN